MDAAVTEAITAVHLDDEGIQQRWFELICQTYDEVVGAGEWARFTESFNAGVDAAGLGRALAEQFIEYLNFNDSAPLETIGRMRQLDHTLPAHYRELTAEGTGTADAPEYDDANWNAFLAANGARWDGDDASWGQFKEWFVYLAEQQGLAEPASRFITHLENQGDKVAVFAQYGLRVVGAGSSSETEIHDVGAYPHLKEGDSGEWVDYLDATLTSKGF